MQKKNEAVNTCSKNPTVLPNMVEFYHNKPQGACRSSPCRRRRRSFDEIAINDQIKCSKKESRNKCCKSKEKHRPSIQEQPCSKKLTVNPLETNEKCDCKKLFKTTVTSWSSGSKKICCPCCKNKGNHFLIQSKLWYNSKYWIISYKLIAIGLKSNQIHLDLWLM